MDSIPGYDVSGLIVGTAYTVVAVVWRGPGSPVVVAAADNEAFGSPVLLLGEWSTSRGEFTATAETQRVGLARIDSAMGRVYLGGVVCTPSPWVGGYFDGGSGEDYVWSGTPDDSPSCYYPDKANRSYLISQLLAENCPLGVTPGVPQFGVLPT